MKKLTLVLILLILAGCQSKAPTNQPLEPASDLSTPTSIPAPTSTAETSQTEPTLALDATNTPASTAASLAPLTIDWEKPFADLSPLGDEPASLNWEGGVYAGEKIPLPVDPARIRNSQVLDGLTDEQREFLQKNGFAVLHSQEEQFADIREEVAIRTGQPYYLTSDAAYHALHLQFDELLKALEREYFRPRMIAITRAVLDQVSADSAHVQGTPIEDEMQQALAYLSVALGLLDPASVPASDIDPATAELVDQQVEQIQAAGGREKSALFPETEEDFGAYRPTGHYAGDPDLEAYFRGLTWLGRMHFLLEDASNPDFKPSRLPLIVTRALRTAQVDGQPAAQAWADLHQTLDFVIGPSDDAGPLEYAALMDQVYGPAASLQDLADPALWQDFLARSDQLPIPQVNSLFVASTKDLSGQKGWRFMGQRFTLDGMILQNLIFDRVDPKPDNTRRELPSGLDVMTAFGSQPAGQELEKMGVTEFPNYPEQMQAMQQAVQARTEQEWLGRFYDGWLYSFLPILVGKGAAYPEYMQTPAWGYKDLNAALGSWAELKHDTVLYTKMPEMAAGGGPPMSGPAPSVVEPNPAAFARMATIANTLACGLQERVLHEPCLPGSYGYPSDDASGHIYAMGELGQRFDSLAKIAAKELAGQPLDAEDNALITACLGMIECMNIDTGYLQPEGEMSEVPVVAAVSGAGEDLLEVGVGNVDRIYVLVPLEGGWQAAQGGIFSYYEFPQPRADRLTDEAWREMLANGEVELPAWASNFILPGGVSQEALAFRVGDAYIITKAGDKLNVRDQASLKGKVLTQLSKGTYVEILDGPVQAGGYTWWKVKVFDDGTEGWAVENPEWYIRSYRPDQSVE